MTDIPMALEPCADSVLAHLAADPMPYPDLAGQLDDPDIARISTVTITEEYL